MWTALATQSSSSSVAKAETNAIVAERFMRHLALGCHLSLGAEPDDPRQIKL
jgi:hypothetical protein